jgi:tetratricopeptide (TPR) repeat protein
MFHEDRYLHQEIRRLKKQMKQNPLLFARLGDCYLRLGAADQAQAALTEGMRTVRDYPNAYRVLAELQFWKGFYRDAEESCRQGLERDPNHLGLLHLLMRIKKKEDNDSEAGRLQKTIARLDPLHAPEFVIETETRAQAESETEAPSPAEVWQIKPSRRGRKKEADTGPAPEMAPAHEIGESGSTSADPARDLKAAAPKEPKANPQNGLELQKYLTEIITSTDKPDEAEELSESAGEAAPAPGGIATRTLAELYAKQGKYDEAIEIYRQLLDMDPDNEPYQIRLRELVQMQETDSQERGANQDG